MSEPLMVEYKKKKSNTPFTIKDCIIQDKWQGKVIYILDGVMEYARRRIIQ